VWFSLWSDTGVPAQRYSTLSPKRSQRSIKLIFVLTVIGAVVYLGFIYVDVTGREWGESSSQKRSVKMAGAGTFAGIPQAAGSMATTTDPGPPARAATTSQGLGVSVSEQVRDANAEFGTPPAPRASSANHAEKAKVVAKRQITPIERHPLPRGRTYVQYGGWDNGFPFRPSR
jgi:hypothetical protein